MSTHPIASFPKNTFFASFCLLAFCLPISSCEKGESPDLPESPAITGNIREYTETPSATGGAILPERNPSMKEVSADDTRSGDIRKERDNNTRSPVSTGTGQLMPKDPENRESPVSQVIDGDTIHVLVDGNTVKIRLIGIDAPESTGKRYGYAECFGDEAKEHLKILLRSGKVRLEFDESQGKLDKYGRTLAFIFSGSENINERMVRDGYAYEYTYRKPYRYSDSFKQAQIMAQQGRLGFWSKEACDGKRTPQASVPGPSVTTPSDRAGDGNTARNDSGGIGGSDGCTIKGNVNAKGQKLYHLPGCRSYNATMIDESQGEKWFCTESEAIAAGWKKAGNCR